MSIYADHGVKQLFAQMKEMDERVKFLEDAVKALGDLLKEPKIDRRTKAWKIANSRQ